MDSKPLFQYPEYDVCSHEHSDANFNKHADAHEGTDKHAYADKSAY